MKMNRRNKTKSSARTLKRAEKGNPYVVLTGKPSKPRFAGTARTLTSAMRKLPKSGKGAIAHIDKAWAWEKPKRKPRKKSRKSK